MFHRWSFDPQNKHLTIFSTFSNSFSQIWVSAFDVYLN
uniref:Uncharacterized protein n=1 Tax=Heterorhabditis bacteriophora TaxID=37862 RepID=A0A1I7W9W1_HETBA